MLVDSKETNFVLEIESCPFCPHKNERISNGFNRKKLLQNILKTEGVSFFKVTTFVLVTILPNVLPLVKYSNKKKYPKKVK